MIKVNIKNETETGWDFEVIVDESEYEVEVFKWYWEKLTSGKTEPAELVKKSFEFLLEREPKEAILKKFNLKLISEYFPEYEKEIVAK